MKGIYLMLAAVFITLMISPAAYSTEPSNMSMGYFKEMETNVTVYVDANSSDADSSDDEEPVEWEGLIYEPYESTVVECSYGGRMASGTEKPEDPYTLGFVGGSFTPTERLDSRIQNKLAYAGEDDYTYCFVMIFGRGSRTEMDTLIEHGVKLLGYHSHHCYKAKIPLNRVEEIERLPFIKWIGYAPSDLKIHPILKEKISSGRSDDDIRVRINVFDSDLNENSEEIVHNDGKQYYTYMPNGPFRNKLEEMGVTILAYDDGLMTFTGRASPDTISRIADLDFVHFISSEPDPMMKRIAHDQSIPDIGADYIRPLSSSYEVYVDEPSEQEENTMEDSNPGIVTTVRMAFAYIQRKLL